MASARSSQKVGQPCWSATTSESATAGVDLTADGLDEIAAAAAVEPGRSHDRWRSAVRAEFFAAEFGTAIGAARRHRVVFRIRALGIAGEDVIGGNLDQLGRRPRCRPRARWPTAVPLTAVARILVVFAVVNRGVSRRS